MCIVFSTEVDSLLGVKGDSKAKKKGKGFEPGVKGSKSTDKNSRYN